MKKILICAVHNDYMSLELGISKHAEGCDVYFVGCDKSFGVCGFFNPRGCSPICSLCEHAMKKQILELVKSDGKRYHYIPLSKLISEEIITNSLKAEFHYNNTKELKALVYKDVEIGFAAFSSFVSLTRNVTPTYNQYFKKYINNVLRAEIRLTDAIEKYIDELKPDLIVFHNGRMPNCKPPYCLAKSKNIDYISTERIPSNGKCVMDNFLNDVPHSYAARNKKIEKCWGKAGKEKYEISKSFYENRYHSKPAGDTIYTRNQNLGRMPEGFDPTKRNIVIFNSSEDEYCSISKERDEDVLYPTQYEALSRLFDHYKDNKDIHFYLRIHPNLADVPYKSHMQLYELATENVTIISPRSDISSYTLMENAEKVIVFDSTMGLESSYWGKPVIALCICAYSGLGVVYEPENEREFFDMVDNKNLPPKECHKEIYYKLAFRLMRQVGEPLKYFECYEKKAKIPLINKTVKEYSAFKFWGSSLLYGVLYALFDKLSEKGCFTKYGDSFFKSTI